MLQFAAILCFVAYFTEPNESMHLVLGIFLYSVVILTSLFSYVQQFTSDKTLREFRNFLPPKATVLRDGGFTHVVDAANLVVGDIVKLKLGDKVPADVRVLHSNRFTVDNSSLTGESEPVELNPDVSNATPLEATNMAFFGCLAVDGSCTAVVVATGDRTVFGEIARLSTSTVKEEGEATLKHDIHHFVVSISFFAVSVGLLFFIVGLFKGTRPIPNIVYSIGIIVSNIPEGLLATVTVSLTASARRMAKKSVLVKQLNAVETLGSTTVICSDKTGTLTQNKMNVAHIVYGGHVELIDPDWSSPVSFNTFSNQATGGTDRCLTALVYGASVCSTAVFDRADVLLHPDKAIVERDVCGDASEAGILRFTQTLHDVETFRSENKLVTTIPFNSKNKYMVSVHACPDSEHILRVVVKGAPERLVPRCSFILSRDGVREMTERDRHLIDKQMCYLASQGERVLGYAEQYTSPQVTAKILDGNGSRPNVDAIPTSELCFVGLLSLRDPPRDAVPEAVLTCKDAGIKVIMVTGDHHDTARSIAQQVGIITKEVAEDSEVGSPSNRDVSIVVKGSEIEDISAEKWADIFSHREIVFARTSPRQKLEIVNNLQLLGEVVTVTGDGCNDAPALRQANTGVSMGISGSDVSREAANIVILDDNFASIVNGVKEGRLIFDNLKKSIAYTLISNVPQLVPFLAFITLQIPLPLTTVLILSIDLGTDIFPAIALAYEQPESDIMKRPPRNARKDHLMNQRLVSYSSLQLGIIQTFAGFFAYFMVMRDYGLAPQTLPLLNKGSHFGTGRINDQRWLYSAQQSVRSVGYDAQWFSRDNPKFAKYFNAKLPGFVKQEEDRYKLLPASGKTVTVHESKSNPDQFPNMIKIIGVETQQPPCLAYTCNLDKTKTSTTENDFECFNIEANTGSIILTGASSQKKNNKVISGKGSGKGCFDLWTPRREKEVLKRAQTAFFAAVVVAQVFTLFACKTRILSLFGQGIRNSALLISLAFEITVTLVLVYSPLLKSGLNVRPLRFIHWLPGVPFGIFIIIYDECRKWMIRRHIENESGNILPKHGPLDRLAKWVHDFTLW